MLFATLTLPLGCGESRSANSHDGSVPALDGSSGAGGGSGDTGGTTAIGSGGSGVGTGGTGAAGVGGSAGAGGRSGMGGTLEGTGGATTGFGGSTASVDGGVDASLVSDVARFDSGVDGNPAGDVSSAGGVDGPAVTPCPSLPPRDRNPCDGSLQCFYEDCAGAGRTVAACAQGAWSVTVDACQSYLCQSGTVSATCAAGTVCVAIASGFPIAQCVQNSCGAGPISCSCLGACTGTCSLRGTATQGIIVECNPSCPPGGCA